MNLPLIAFLILSAHTIAFAAETVNRPAYRPYGVYQDGTSDQKFFDKSYRPYGASPLGKHPYGPYGTVKSKKKSLVPDVVEANWQKRQGN